MRRILLFFFTILFSYGSDCNNPIIIEKLNNALNKSTYNLNQSRGDVVYSFNVKINGKVDINLSSINNFGVALYKNRCPLNALEFGRNINKSINVSSGDRVYLRVKSVNNVSGIVTFTPEVIEDTHDICYRQQNQKGFFCFKDPFGIPISGGLNCKYTYNIDVYGNLEDVVIEHVDPTLFQGNAFKSCGINPKSSVRTCKIANRIDLWKFGFLDKSLEYNLSNLSSDDNLSIWVKSIVNLELFSSENTYVRYIKNGYLHIGRLNKCQDYTNANLLDFKKIFDKKLNGRLVLIGNTNVCKTNNTGKCINPSRNDNNDNINLQYVKVDNISNVSYSFLNLNANDEIIWAGLFWQGRIKTENPNESSEVKKAKIVKFKTPNSNGYQDIEAVDNNFNWYYSDKYNIFDYAGFAEVTNLVKSAKSGKYYLKDLQISTGRDISGGWSLVVVVKNRDNSFKKIVVYQGFQPLWNKKGFNNSISLKVDGFKSKSKGKIESNLIFFSNETDVNMGDNIKVNGKKISNNSNPQNDIMNSTISIFGKNYQNRYPNFNNNLGVNIDEFNLSDIVENSQSSTDIIFSTQKDRYLLSMVGFSVELDIPKICFYDLKIFDETNNKVSTNKLQKNKRYTIKFNIKNDEKFKVSNFYVINKFKNQKYINNSTYVKNANQKKLRHINDGSSVNGVSVNYNNNILSIGKIKDENNSLSPYKKENYAIIKFKEIALIDGKFDNLIYGDYYFGNANYGGLLPQCKTNEPKPKIITGNFDAYDFDESILHRVIKTKIAGKSFVLKIAFISPKSVLTNIYAYYQLYDMNSNTQITPFEAFDLANTLINKSFNIDKAYKNVRVRFKYCKNTINNMIVAHSLCDTNTPGYKYEYSYSTDAFAIRPYRFVLNIPSKAIANKKFNISISALDFNNNPLNNYNETLSFTSSPVIEYNETKPGCYKGVLSLVNYDFSNGELKTNAKYSDIGRLQVTIKEKEGSEFAKIDNSDTPFLQRRILGDSKTINIKPYKFLIAGNLYNFKNTNFTYISNDLNMSAKLNLTLQAVGYNNALIKNYTKNCYAKGSTLKLIFDSNQPIRKLLMKTNNYTSIDTDSIVGYINQTLQKDIFEQNSTAKLSIRLNFEKNYQVPVGEFDFNINKIIENDGEINGSTNNIPGIAHFIYGYFQPHDVYGYPKRLGNSYELNSKFKILYFDASKGWIINNYHYFNIHGDINLSKSIAKNITIQKQAVNNGILEMKFITNHEIPYSSKVHVAIPSWLWYHPLAKNYQEPSLSNQDCLTHPCFNVTYINQSLGWGGVGSNDNKNPENNKTSKIKSSYIKLHKNSIKKINW